MPLPFIVEITSQSTGKIKGSSQMYGLSAVVLAYSFEHRVHVSRDNPDGDDGGLRFHDPLTICKEIDKSSPVLYQHLVTGGLLSDVTMRFYKYGPGGKEINYHTIVLEDAIITDVSPEMKLTFLRENERYRHMEYVSFSYRTIRWVDELGLTETSDSKKLLHDPEEESELLSGAALPPSVEDPGTFNLMFVDHDTMEVVGNVNAKITHPDGKSQNVLSSQNGSYCLKDVQKGLYTLAGFSGKNPSAWIGNSYSLEKVDQPRASELEKLKPSGGKGNQSRHHSAFKHLCNIKAHQIQKGELFSSVAKKHGFSLEELAFFNWGSKDRQKVTEQQQLRFACGELAPSGEEYYLNEGTIYIPEPVEKTGLSTSTQHVAFLKQAGQRDVKARLLTSANHPIPNVEATLTLGDDSSVTAISDEDGVALFTGVPSDLEGEITYADEGDLMAKSHAANMHAAIKGADMESLMCLLQSAVDFSAVRAAYQENYKGDAGEAIRGAFSSDTQKDVVDFLLVKTGLADDGTLTLYEETQPA